MALNSNFNSKRRVKFSLLHTLIIFYNDVCRINVCLKMIANFWENHFIPVLGLLIRRSRTEKFSVQLTLISILIRRSGLGREIFSTYSIKFLVWCYLITPFVIMSKYWNNHDKMAKWLINLKHKLRRTDIKTRDWNKHRNILKEKL